MEISPPIIKDKQRFEKSPHKYPKIQKYKKSNNQKMDTNKVPTSSFNFKMFSTSNILPNVPSTKLKSRLKFSNFSKISSMLVLIFLLHCVQLGFCGDLGGHIIVPVTIEKKATPYLVTDDIIIDESGELTIRPGVTLLFSPTKGITVFGRLIAEGTETDRILLSTSIKTSSHLSQRLTSQNDNFYSPNLNQFSKTRDFFNTVQYSTATEPVLTQLVELNEKSGNETIKIVSKRDALNENGLPSVRLVEGPSILVGRLQIYHRGQWRSVCSNSRNWTQVDMETVCRELGFSGGEYWTWVDHLNDTKQLLWEKPQCKGSESQIKDCPNWNSRQMGSGVCDHHPNIGLRCDTFHKFPSSVESHWRGIRFHHSKYRDIYENDNTLKSKDSLSSLKYVDILYAGVGSFYNATSAVEVMGVPPSMEFVNIEYSAFNGINVTETMGRGRIRNSTINSNAGIGIFVNSSLHSFEVESSEVRGNGGDGVHFILNDQVPDQVVDGIEPYEFCTVSTHNQLYPLRLYFETLHDYNSEKGCRKTFSVKSGYVLTMHFPHMRTWVLDGATILVYDGIDSRGNLLASLKPQNNTWPQSVTSTKESLYVEIKAKAHNGLLIYMDLVAGKTKDAEFRLAHSLISSNNGRGLYVENMRSMVHVHSSTIEKNTLISGVEVRGGVGHVNITHTTIKNNVGDGLNVTTGGGSRNVSRSVIMGNSGRGFSIWVNESSVKIPVEQNTVVEYSEIGKNGGVGVRVGNFCTNGVVNISGNVFKENPKVSIEVESCWHMTKSSTFRNLLSLIISHNKFLRNTDFSLSLSPLVNTDALIEHNYFHENKKRGCVVVGGVDRRELENLPADVEISNNVFERNSGVFVVSLGLSHKSGRQRILFTQNFVRYNTIEDPSGLNARSRVSAPIVLTSANVDVYRNILGNIESRYEIGSQMTDQSIELNCTYNWLGSNEEKLIYYRIFDRKDRFNLAKILFIPFLLNPTDPNTEIVYTNSLFVPSFDNSEKIIGGEVTGRESLTNGEYKVVRDISVRPGGRLQISYGVSLKFLPSVGLMVGGQFHSEGYGYGDGEMVKFTLLDIGRVNMTDVGVRLVGGKTRKDGRLQVRINNQWGSICNYGFDIRAASIACRQMGFVLNPSDWLLESYEIPQASPSEQIIFSNVKCSEWETELSECEGEKIDELENSCGSSNVVGIRCYDSSWAGIRMGATAEKGVLKFTSIDKAGLLDPHTNEHKPALQLDFSHHVLSDIRVNDNTGDGLGVIYSDLYFPDNVNTVERSEFSRNLGNGISLRQLGLNIKDCTIENNRESGILQNPVLSRSLQREISGWIISTNKKDSLVHLPMRERDLWLDPDVAKYLITSPEPNVNEVYNIVSKDQNFVISIQILGPIVRESSEEIVIYDRMDIPARDGIKDLFPDLDIWSLPSSSSSFPRTSSSYGVTLWFKTGPMPRGSAILLVRAVRSRGAPWSPLRVVPKLKLGFSRVRYNGGGISGIRYNGMESEEGDVYLRKGNESIEIVESEVSFNRGEAVRLSEPLIVREKDWRDSTLTETTIVINGSTIMENEKGITQSSRELRNSNNIYHWHLSNTIIDRNKDGGVQISLPYVWAYNENHTHSLKFHNSTFQHNLNFELKIKGHFAKIVLTNSLFRENSCKNGLFSLGGMEKEIMIHNNVFSSNSANYVVLFEADSQSEILGQVQAHFVQNEVKNNRLRDLGQFSRGRGRERNYVLLSNATYEPKSYVIGLKGVQKVNVTNNLFGGNGQEYELLAGVRTARIDNTINVIKNWWGTSDPTLIKSRIFDFDDWNSYAIASYRPYYTTDSFQSPISVTFESNNDITLDNLKGRLEHPLTLYYRKEPYVIMSDLTIMPSASLTIAPGVVLEFYPSVGILALGQLFAQGTQEAPIMMRPITVKKMESLDDFRPFETQSPSLRLCLDDSCPPGSSHGFLEQFNTSTLQWIPSCDRKFSERNAVVACRSLGHDFLNAHFLYGRRPEFTPSSLTRVRSWASGAQCGGHEENIEDCPLRYAEENEEGCGWDGEFLYLNCGRRNLNKTMEYWGGIRFCESDFEHHVFHSRMHDAVTHSSYEREESILEYVNLIGAGILHNEKSPAVLSIGQSPQLRFINITKSASHGIAILSSTRTMRMTRNFISDNLGIGFTALSLTGESRGSDSSSFSPLKTIELPSSLFGLIDICDTTKEVVVEERVVLYYKYDNFPVDCVKIFTSVYGAKNLGFRLLQFNLFNNTHPIINNDANIDFIKLIDGDIYNSTTSEIVSLSMRMGGSGTSKFYKSTWPSLSVKFHGTGGTGYHGFVAEILTLPVSPHGFDRTVQHNVSYSTFENNTRGAFYYGTAGEISPTVTLEKNRFENNGVEFYGNFTSCNATISFDVQNMLNVYFKNNVVRGNQGGLSIISDSSGTPTSLKAYVYNNVFENNKNRPVVHFEGRRSSPYQELVFYRNFLTRNDGKHTDLILLSQVVSNVTENYVVGNRAEHILEVFGFEKVRLPIYQSTTHNSFFMNYATSITDRSTIVAGSTGQQYIDNIFVNPANDYELLTVNKSRYEPQSAVDARHNWWGYKEQIPVMGRIKDENDNVDLLRVLFLPFRTDNRTLLSGKCPPGYTLLSDTCYIYIGGHMNFSEAREFCRRENASMPYVEKSYYYVTNFLRGAQEDYDYYDRVWVQDVDRFEQCTVFVTGGVRVTDCSFQLPFICETDPKIRIDPLAWTSDSVTIGALVSTILALVMIVFILVFWYTKSNQRQMERLERRNSVRASIRSSRSFSSMGSLSEVGYRRRLAEIQKSMNGAPDLSAYNKVSSFESISKSNSELDSTSYDLYDTQTLRTPMSSEFGETLSPVSSHPMGRERVKPLPNPRYFKREQVIVNTNPRAVLYNNQTNNGVTDNQNNMGNFTKNNQSDSYNRNNLDDSGYNQNNQRNAIYNRNNHGLSSLNDPLYNQNNQRNGIYNQNNPNDPLYNQNSYPYNPNGVMSSPNKSYDSSNHSDNYYNQNNRIDEDYNSNNFQKDPRYKNGNAEQDGGSLFPRTVSMVTTSTFPLQPSSESLTSAAHAPVSLSSYPIYDGRENKTHQLSKSYDELSPPNSDWTYFPSGSKYEESPGERNALSSSDYFRNERTELDGDQFPSPFPKLKETSLDALDNSTELDYELSETVRPISTFLETSLDNGESGKNLPTLRNAQSQFIHSPHGGYAPTPHSSYQSGGFKALSSRSKSMPLETEM